MRRNNQRNVPLALLLVGLFLTLFGLLFGPGISTLESSRAARAERLDPASAAQIEQRAPGREVLVEGTIDPRSRQRYANLVAFVTEELVDDSDNDQDWREVERVAPALLLALPDGTVQVVAGNYSIEAPSQQIDEGDIRRRGFVAGDAVTAIGFIVAGSEGNAIDVEILFGGSREEYIARSRTNAATFGWVGFGIAAVGILILGIGGWQFFRRGR